MSDFKLFIDAIKNNSEDAIKKFKIEFLEIEDKNSYRPIHHACRSGRVELVKLLLSNNCKIDVETMEGYQPIHLASMNDQIDVMKLLIENNCDINATDKNGNRPIHMVYFNNNIDILKLLIANKCDINAFTNLLCHHIYSTFLKDKFGTAELRFTITSGNQLIHLACMNGQIDIVKILVEKKCEINSFNNFGYQPIHLACISSHIDIVKILITNKCNLNAFSTIGYQPIHLACMNGHFDIVKLLIANKSDINASNKITGYQPIHYACKNGHFDIVKLLIANKCDINASNYLGQQPIYMALKKGHIDIVKLLIENNYKMNDLSKYGYQPIHIECILGCIDKVKTLIANKCDINASDKKGFQPIHLACRHGHIDIVKLLIANKCNIHSTSRYNNQPIHSACKNGHIDIVKLLIANQCDINATGEFLDQPIHLACMKGHTDIVKILVENNCDISKYNDEGEQPIHLACKYRHIDMVKIFIENKCNLNALSKYGKRPISIARINEHVQMVNLLDDAILIESIAKAIDLHCESGCDHKFCRKSLQDKEFTPGEFIGEGGFGAVYKYRISNTDRVIVIKQTEEYCEDMKNIEGNINKYLSTMLHNNIVRYFGALEKSGKLGIFMEYMAGGSIKNLIDKLKKKKQSIEHWKVIKFSKQILYGLQFLHSKGIIHRDIKPDNMLLDRDYETLKLTDFGLSKSLSSELISENIAKTKTFRGTTNYLAPEVYMEESYGFPADIWSTGASIINMITGEIPFNTKEIKVSQKSVAFTFGKTVKRFRTLYEIPEAMQSFINGVLNPNQLDRPSAESLLNHSIF